MSINQNEIKKSEQNIQNKSFDEKYDQLAVEIVAEKYIDGTNDQLKRVSGKDVGNDFALATSVIDGVGLIKGGQFSEILTLTNANTAYTVPSTAQNVKCTMVLYNGSDTSIYLRATTGTSGGIEIAPSGKVTVTLDANVQVYVYCGTAGKTLNVEMFKLE